MACTFLTDEDKKNLRKEITAYKKYVDGEVEKVTVGHEWNGTVLNITTGSGTSGVDLKGDPLTVAEVILSTENGGENEVTFSDGSRLAVRNGEQGEPGPTGLPGIPGPSGYTPERGVDYWTEEDKAEIKAHVDEEVDSAVGAEKERAIARENEIEALFSMPAQEAVDKWLDEHPEATTTVQDASLKVEKFTKEAQEHIVKDYATPQMYMLGGLSFTEALNKALEENKTVFIPEGTFDVDGTIEIPNGCTLRGFGVGVSVLQFVNDVDCIKIGGKKTTLTDLEIRTKVGLHFTNTVITIYADKKENSNETVINTNVTVSNVNFFPLEFANHAGTGIKLIATQKNKGISYAKLDNIQINNLKYGIYLEDDQQNKNGWVTANRITDCSFVSCQYGVYIASAGVAGNEFNFQYQPPVDKELLPAMAVYCEGRENIFTGYCWDVLYTDFKVAEFTSSSQGNKLNLTNSKLLHKKHVDDKGSRNEVFGDTNDIASILLPSSTDVRYNNGYERFSHLRRNIIGDQNNCLAFADKIANVSYVGTRNNDSYFQRLFNPFAPFTWSTANFKYPNDYDVGQVIIDYGSKGKTLDRLSCIGVVFGGVKRSTKIQLDIEYYSGYNNGYPNTVPVNAPDTEPKSGSLTIENNTKSVIEFDLTEVDDKIPNPVVSKITLTFSKGDTSTTGVNPDGGVALEAIYGVQNCKNEYTPFLHKGGGDVYGDIVFESKKGVCLFSPNGTKYRITVGDDGVLKATTA